MDESIENGTKLEEAVLQKKDEEQKTRGQELSVKVPNHHSVSRDLVPFSLVGIISNNRKSVTGGFNTVLKLPHGNTTSHQIDSVLLASRRLTRRDIAAASYSWKLLLRQLCLRGKKDAVFDFNRECALIGLDILRISSRIKGRNGEILSNSEDLVHYIEHHLRLARPKSQAGVQLSIALLIELTFHWVVVESQVSAARHKLDEIVYRYPFNTSPFISWLHASLNLSSDQSERTSHGTETFKQSITSQDHIKTLRKLLDDPNTHSQCSIILPSVIRKLIRISGQDISVSEFQKWIALAKCFPSCLPLQTAVLTELAIAGHCKSADEKHAKMKKEQRKKRQDTDAFLIQLAVDVAKQDPMCECAFKVLKSKESKQLVMLEMLMERVDVYGGMGSSWTSAKWFSDPKRKASIDQRVDERRTKVWKDLSEAVERLDQLSASVNEAWIDSRRYRWWPSRFYSQELLERDLVRCPQLVRYKTNVFETLTRLERLNDARQARKNKRKKAQ